MMRAPPVSPLFPYTTLFRSRINRRAESARDEGRRGLQRTNRYVRESGQGGRHRSGEGRALGAPECVIDRLAAADDRSTHRSEEHTSELQSRVDLVCRLLLEK